MRRRAPRRSVDDLAFAARGQRQAAVLALGKSVRSPNIDPDFLAALTTVHRREQEGVQADLR